MRALDEWNIVFDVIAPRGVGARGEFDRLMDDAIEWAEERALGIGGGASPVRGRARGEGRWRFDGGLCVQRDGDLITEEQAREFLAFLSAECADRGLGFEGKVEPFRDEEA